MVSIEATQRNLTINTQMASENLELVVDGQRVKEVVAILLENAIKFSQNATINVTVWVDNKKFENSSISPKTYLHVSVEDQGPGIQPEDLLQIFNYGY